VKIKRTSKLLTAESRI